MNEAPNTPPATSAHPHTCCSEDIMCYSEDISFHIIQQEMKYGEVIQTTKTRRQLTLMKKTKKMFLRL